MISPFEESTFWKGRQTGNCEDETLVFQIFLQGSHAALNVFANLPCPHYVFFNFCYVIYNFQSSVDVFKKERLGEVDLAVLCGCEAGLSNLHLGTPKACHYEKTQFPSGCRQRLYLMLKAGHRELCTEE